MTQPASMHKVAAALLAATEAAGVHHAQTEQAKREWQKATHPIRRPTRAEIDAASERYRVAFNASLRVYLKAIRELDDER